MKPVNPELMSESDPSVPLDSNSAEFAAGVEKLFGSKNRNLRRAVAEFLDKGTGSFDHNNLRLVAATGAAFSDVNQVAQIIRQLRPTGLDIAAQSIDLETTREEFAASLPDKYRPETKRNLILDLINRTTLDVLRQAPFERVPEQGRAIVRDHLKRTMRQGAMGPRTALLDRFADESTCDAALDLLEEKLERVERETAAGQRVGVPSGTGIIFYQVVDNRRVIASDAQLDRAWRLYQRCVPSEGDITPFVRNRRMMAIQGSSISKAVEALAGVDPAGASRLRDEMIDNPGTPEEIVRHVIRTASEPLIHGSRIALLRLNHYETTDDLLPTPTPSDLDDAVLSMRRPSDVNWSLTRGLETDDALTKIVERAPQLADGAFEGILANQNLKSVHLSRLIETLRPEQSLRGGMGHHARALFAHSGLDDSQLKELVQKVGTFYPDYERERRESLMIRAAAHPSSGEAVWEMVESHSRGMPGFERSRFLHLIAMASGSPQMHAALTRLSIESQDEGLAADLMSNPVLRSANWHLLRDRFPHLEPSDEVAEMLATHVLGRVRWDTAYQKVDILVHKGLMGYDKDAVRSIVASGDGSPVATRVMIDKIRQYVHPDVMCQLLDADGSGDRLAALTEEPDTHLALMAATSPRVLASDRESGFVLNSVKELRDTAYAVSHEIGSFPEDKKLHSWKKLPNRDDEPFEWTDLHQLIDGQVIDGLSLDVVRTRRNLVEASEEMHNCLSGYVDAVASGDSIVALTRTDDDVYAAAFTVYQRDDDRAPHRVGLDEVNSKFNEGNVSPEFMTGLAEMVQKINSGELQTVDVQPPDVRVRPQPRRAVPALRTHLDQAAVVDPVGQGLPEAPSLLGAMAPDTAEQQTPREVLGVDAADTPSVSPVDPGHGDTTLDF